MEIEEIKTIKAEQNDFFKSGKTKDLSYRIQALKTLRKAIKENSKTIADALKEDLNKSEAESYLTETGMALASISYSLKHIKSWAKPKRVNTPLAQFPSSSHIVPEPYGVCLIIAPWNYPFLLAIDPLIAAISAGNCAIVKPSELSPATSKLIGDIISNNFEQSYIAVAEGGKEISETLLSEQFDYIFFTGGTSIGRIVMQKAAENLTPVTLELGGKSPCIIDKSADIELAVKRILFGKIINSGQTCVAPDYLLVHTDIKDKIKDAFAKYSTKMLGENALENKSYPRIINRRHFDRLVAYLQDGEIISGGEYRTDTLQISPTLLSVSGLSSKVMEEEIFGPILPLITYNSTNNAINIINSRPKPLALYLFTTDSNVESNVIKNVSFGGGCINDTIIHLASPKLPFGGVGSSGMGAYHGKYGFDTFSHHKSILKKANWLDLPFRYPPFSKIKLQLIKLFLG